MDKKSSDDLVYSKVLIQKLVEHKDMFGIPDNKADLQRMSLSDYRDMLQREAFFYVDHNGLLRHQFSGEVIAATLEQASCLIQELTRLKDEHFS